MGAQSGSLGHLRLRADIELGERWHQQFSRSVRARAFQPLEVSSESEESEGWCVMGRPFDLELGSESIWTDRLIHLGYRVDKWRLPSTSFRAKLDEGFAAYKEKMGRPRLSQKEKEQVKFQVTMAMRKKLIPSLAFADMTWDLDTGIVRFFSRSNKMVEGFSALFEKTFGVEPVLLSPYSLARELGFSQEQLEDLANSTPLNLKYAGENAERWDGRS